MNQEKNRKDEIVSKKPLHMLILECMEKLAPNAWTDQGAFERLQEYGKMLQNADLLQRDTEEIFTGLRKVAILVVDGDHKHVRQYIATLIAFFSALISDEIID